MSPDLSARWFGPDGADVPIVEMEVTLGGRLELTLTFPGTDFEVGIEGFYEVIEPASRLVNTRRSMDRSSRAISSPTSVHRTALRST